MMILYSLPYNIDIFKSWWQKILKLYQLHGNFVLFTLLPIIIIDGGLMWGLTSPHMGPHFLIRIPAQKA